MGNEAVYHAFICVQPKERGGKARWVKVGHVFAHRNGEGIDLVLPEGLAVFGRVVCLPPLPNEKEPNEKGEA
jgi:hypothetical protein